MLITTIRCETTAPMFMAGANQKNPELRAPSFKGVMRYIWRAVQCASKLDDLLLREGKIFGNADGERTRVSPLKLRITEWDAKVDYDADLAPHRGMPEYTGSNKDRRIPATAIGTASTLTVQILTGANVNREQHLNYVRLFVLTCALAGFGRRSRKGMGTLDIRTIEGEGSEIAFKISALADLPPLLNAVSIMQTSYACDGDSVRSSAPKPPAAYPHIEEIYILPAKNGKTPADIARRIGLATHENGDVFTGLARPRFASPLLLSALSDPAACIVTRLRCTKDFDAAKRNAFIDELRGRILG